MAIESEIEALNEAAEMCRTLGFADYQMKRFSNEIEGIWLEDAKIEAVESYLKTHCGYQPKADKMQEVRDMIRRYKGRSPAADLVCGNSAEKSPAIRCRRGTNRQRISCAPLCLSKIIPCRCI